MNVIINLLYFSVMILFLTAFLLSSIYKRANKKIAYTRSAHGGELVLLDNSAFALPILNHVIPVNLTQDLTKLDMTVDFYVRVLAEEQHIRYAGQTLGKITTKRHAFKHFLQGKFVSACFILGYTLKNISTLANSLPCAVKTRIGR